VSGWCYSLRENGALWKSRPDRQRTDRTDGFDAGALAPQWSPDGKRGPVHWIFSRQASAALSGTEQWRHSARFTSRFVEGIHAFRRLVLGWEVDFFDYFEGEYVGSAHRGARFGQNGTLPDSQGLIQAEMVAGRKFIAANQQQDTRTILLYSLATKKWSVLAESTNAQGMRWSADSNYVYYQEMADTEQSILPRALGARACRKKLSDLRITWVPWRRSVISPA
jgi:hypothetical protein